MCTMKATLNELLVWFLFTCVLCVFSVACFFLLSCVKGKEDISTVFSRNSKVTDLASMRDTIKRLVGR